MRFFIFLILIISVSIFWGCDTKKLFKRTEKEIVLKTPEEVFEIIEKNKPEYEWFSTRFSGSAIWEGRNYNVSGSIRIKKDSAIFVSVTPVLGIEVARLLISNDSVKFLNRLESSYYVGDNSFMNRIIGANLDYQMVQALIIGDDFPHYETENFLMVKEAGKIILSNSQRKKSDNHLLYLSQDLIIGLDNFKVRENAITDPAGSSVRANYPAWENIDGQLFPAALDLMFTDKNTNAELYLKYNRMAIDTPRNMSFRIPPRYEEISF